MIPHNWRTSLSLSYHIISYHQAPDSGGLGPNCPPQQKMDSWAPDGWTPGFNCLGPVVQGPIFLEPLIKRAQGKQNKFDNFEFTKSGPRGDRNWIDRDLAGMVLPLHGLAFDQPGSPACPRAPPSQCYLPHRPTTESDAPPNLRFRRFFATSRVTTLRELNGQLTKIVARGRGLFQYTNSANPALSARRRLTCPCNECGRDKNLTDGQNIFDVFTFSKYFASFLLLITIQSQNYLSFVPQQLACQQQEKSIFSTPECIYQNAQKGNQTLIPWVTDGLKRFSAKGI